MDRVSTHSGSPRSGCADIHRFAQLLYRIHPPKTDAPKGHKAAVRPQSDRLLQSLPLRPCRDWNRKPAPERYSQRKAGAEWPKQLRVAVPWPRACPEKVRAVFRWLPERSPALRFPSSERCSLKITNFGDDVGALTGGFRDLG